MDRTVAEVVGDLIEEARGHLHMTQWDLAVKVGMSVPTISNYERGHRRKFDEGALSRLEQALGMSDLELQVAAGIKSAPPPPPPVRDDRPAVIYEGEHLTDDQRAEVLQFIEWLRYRDRS